MDLIIVESPTKARTLTRFLGKSYRVKATMGHIKDLPKSKLGVKIEDDFEPEYQLLTKKKAVVTEIVGAAKEVVSKKGRVFLATDPDREGEAIAQHVSEILSSDLRSKTAGLNLSRIVFHEITKEAVEEAIGNPGKIDEDLVNAQIARRVLDRLVGYKLSPLLWKKVRRGLSAGRVQTVAVRLVVEREREISSFKAEEYWQILVELKEEKEKFTALLVEIEGKKPKIGNKNEAEAVITDLTNSVFCVLKLVKKQSARSPRPPFTTSTLTQAAANLFFWSSKRSMSVAQKLYEKGLITYHRTDSVNIAEVARQKACSFIAENYGEKYLPPSGRYFKNKSKLAQEAHEAIRPTEIGLKPYEEGSDLEPDQKKLYDLIWKRFLSSQMADSLYAETSVKIGAEGKSGKNYLFKASGLVMQFDGWQVLYPRRKKEDIFLPELKEKETLMLVKFLPEQKFTQPPARYNEASLIKTLEKLGVGRPSTYAPIISTIQLRNYVEKKEGKFYPTAIGTAVSDFLVPNFKDIFDYSFTAKMEDKLDEIAQGKLKWRKVISDFWQPFVLILEDVETKAKRVKIETEKVGRPCPECHQGELVIRTGRFGKFISCSRFPDCKYTEKFIEKIGLKCPECREGEIIVKKTGKGKKFYGCSRYPQCHWASWRLPKLEGKDKEGDQDI